MTFVLGASLLLPAAASAATAASPTVGEIQSSVSFRSQPSTSSTVNRYLKKGEQVVILEQVNSYWYKVQDVNGSIGYISTDDKYVEIVAGGNSGATAGNATIVASVSFRTGPSTDASRIRYLSKGETVTITGQPNSYWYAVTAADGTKGYVSTSSQYITVNGGGSAPGGNPSNGSGSTSGNATIVASVSLRTGPSTDNARIRYLSKGETVTITGQPNSYWYAVTAADGTKGYVSSDSQYITVNGSLPGNPSNGGSSPGSGAGDHSAAIESVIAAGMKYWGTPYEFGSDRNTTKTFDCSDFVRTAYREGANVILPSDSRQQGDYVRNLGNIKTDWHQLKRGDLMFFMSYKGTKASDYAGINKATATITHVGIYLGDGQILQTYSTESGGVRTNVISGHWDYRFLFGGSVL